ncbi:MULTISPECIES: AAA family ATPase [Paenibacillus]|uniref:SMC domain protein n=1 Tax=Paenibacillus lactis 154 TaxID=743719 RepID=G4HNX3_9BACL|nr:AAA family ATPase [Paenibacillus lactis]EHB50137.1 SMC domain protein [Paenibacillus lactis 154]
MKVEKLIIQNIGGIKNLTLEFIDGLNLICGINGVGKSTILDCIVSSFSLYPAEGLRRNSNSEYGEWTISVDGTIFKNSLRIFRPEEQIVNHNPLGPSIKNIIYVKEQRPLKYSRLQSISRDNDFDQSQYSARITNGLNGDSIKNWFINRLAFERQGNFTSQEKHNLQTARNSFSLLDPNVEYSHVLHDSLDIMLKTTRGEIYFEYLSTGFKSCLFIILGIIKEIEFNFKDPKIKVNEFDGVILIDEVDAHLHPYWQGRFLKVLKEVFPSSQIIATTHSPHMIQEADAKEIIALTIDENSNVSRLELDQLEFGFKGWTIEEILEDVMGLKETQSNRYLEVKNEFERAIEHEDIIKAEYTYEILNKMLHPRSPMRKIYQLQLGSIR